MRAAVSSNGASEWRAAWKEIFRHYVFDSDKVLALSLIHI